MANRNIFLSILIALPINIAWASIWKTEVPIYLLVPAQQVIIVVFTGYIFRAINNKLLCLLACLTVSALIGFLIFETFSMIFSENYFTIISERVERGLLFDYLILHLQLNQIFGAPVLGVYFYLVYLFKNKA
jgi:hypothetical protein